jgi:hypothetical protein
LSWIGISVQVKKETEIPVKRNAEMMRFIESLI